MAKRTVEFEDSTGPFTVKLKGDTNGGITLLIHDNGSVTKPTRLHMDLEGPGQVENLGLMLRGMAEELAMELDR